MASSVYIGCQVSLSDSIKDILEHFYLWTSRYIIVVCAQLPRFVRKGVQFLAGHISVLIGSEVPPVVCLPVIIIIIIITIITWIYKHFILPNVVRKCPLVLMVRGVR
jgi:hypothetical protein